jgi:hypothetical protein
VRSECGSCGTTHQHKTHKTELREVHYPWHPLYRQSIPVRLEQRWKNGLVARCDPHSDVGRRGFDIPVWMLDSAVCSTMTLSQTALVDAEALRQLRQLLDRALGTDDSDVVQGGHQLEAVQGGAHAQSVSPTQAAGVVSPPLEDSRLEDPPRDDPRKGVAGPRSDVSGSTGSKRGGSETRRVEQ